ncbi:hypothetical protein BDD12DRAFT_871548 [Trichophaea hybrida]|nr:hypothetical protein BDD12DRAFT_871548 [Trichophaea hybrida]
MAATAPPSHAREPSMTSFDRDVNTRFSFPAQSQDRPPSDFQFPPHYSSSSEPYAFPPRRGSVPLIGTGSLKVPVSSARPRSSQADALKQLSSNSKLVESHSTSGFPSPESPDYVTSTSRASGSSGTRPIGRVVGDGVLPTILNATVRLGPVPDRSSSHNREASELLQVPMLEPQRDEAGPTSIQKRAPPPPGVNLRRGHAHRRSGAISSSDVWSLMNQKQNIPPILTNGNITKAGESVNNDPSRLSLRPGPILSSSAPNSPGMPATEPILPAPDSAGSDSLGMLSDSSDALQRHSRVCFTEKIEVIPRPISAGTESSSTKTVKAHNVTDSLSSAVTASASPSPEPTPRIPSPTRRPQNRTRSNSQTLAMPTAALRAQSDRPSTAGAVLSSAQAPKVLELDIPEIPSLKRPASASPFMNPDESPVKQPPPKKAHKKSQSDFSPLMVTEEFKTDSPTMSEPGSTSGKKKKKGKKQIKNWAGTILGKGKLKHSKRSRKSKSKRAPTPPQSRSAEHLAPGENEWVATSWNESYVIMPIDTSSVVDVKTTVAGGIGSPVIDLDAALSPFKTPIETNTGFAAARRRMHSAASRGGGAYFHRRSESMPEMQLFALEEDEDRTMEDVFEEEEEESTSEEESSEDDDDYEEGQIGGGDGLGIEIHTEEEHMVEWPRKNEAVHVSHTAPTHKRLSTATITAVTVSTTTTSTILDDSMTTPTSRRKGAPADIITPQTSIQSSTSTVNDCPIRYSFIGPALDSPSTFVTASSSPNTPMQTEFPSDCSSGSFDPYRDYLGEPGPEMRMSTDDIPSLTSSSSTMTMNAIYLGMPSTPCTNEALPSPSSITTGGKEKKEKGKRWSRVWGFWRSK